MRREIGAMPGHAQISVDEAVRVRVGRMSGVDKDALLFAYQVARQDTSLESSRLEIEDVKVIIFCPACERPSKPW